MASSTVDLASRFTLVAIIIGLRFYFIYRRSKRAPQRSPRLRRIETIFAISLWSLIAVTVAIVLLLQLKS